MNNRLFCYWGSLTWSTCIALWVLSRPIVYVFWSHLGIASLNHWWKFISSRWASLEIKRHNSSYITMQIHGWETNSALLQSEPTESTPHRTALWVFHLYQLSGSNLVLLHKFGHQTQQIHSCSKPLPHIKHSTKHLTTHHILTAYKLKQNCSQLIGVCKIYSSLCMTLIKKYSLAWRQSLALPSAEIRTCCTEILSCAAVPASWDRAGKGSLLSDGTCHCPSHSAAPWHNWRPVEDQQKL